MSKVEVIPQVIEKVRKLEIHPEYLAAFIFGSVVRNEVTENSDLDVKVITAEENPRVTILHPYINDLKLDLSFQSQKQLLSDMKKEEGRIPTKIPMIGESIILFDKNGTLTKLREEYIRQSPPMFEQKDYEYQNFIVHHANNKVERNLESDPAAALLAMHISINDILKIHYGIHGHWWVSDKRLLKDLDGWDGELAKLIRVFVNAKQVKSKFMIWSQIIDHILGAIGGRKNISLHESISSVSEKGLKDLLSN